MESTIKEKKSREERLELIVVIMLGITALLTAWATWIGSLHGGNQAGNYTLSNNLAAEGNSEYVAAIQVMMQDTMAYNDVYRMMIDQVYAEENGDELEYEKLDHMIDQYVSANFTPELAEAFVWAVEQSDATGETVSPFEMEGFEDSYFVAANDLLTQSEEALAQGTKDNTNGDAYGLVTVIYSVVLFLLGIVGTFKGMKNRIGLICISGAAFLIAMIYMLTIPMPTGFSLSSFFGA